MVVEYLFQPRVGDREHLPLRPLRQDAKRRCRDDSPAQTVPYHHGDPARFPGRTLVSAFAAKAIRGRCGLHISPLVQRNQSGSAYGFRVGPKVLGTLRPATCRGYVRVRHAGAGRVGALAWQHYRLTRWNEHTTLLIASGASTVIGCNAVGRSVAAAIELIAVTGSDGLAFPSVTAIGGGVGCALGATQLWNLLPDGPDTLDKGQDGEVMQTLRENPFVPAVLLVMCTALIVVWQPSPSVFDAIVWGAVLVWLVIAIWRRPNWAALWKPVWGWGWTAFYVLAGAISLLINDTGSGFWWMGVCFLICGVGNAIGLLWWPGRLRHQSPPVRRG
ncbi:MAG: hypothetical protein ACJ76X_14235 [Solirubrobacteraceae bacterium]